MENFGAYLKENREKKGIRLEEIASITKIHIHTLALMEQGKWDELPPEPFIRGFIIAYAKYVGVEPKEAIRRWTEEQIESENLRSPADIVPPASSVHHAEKGKLADEKAEAVLAHDPTLPLGRIAVGFGGLVLFGVVLWLMSLGKSSTPNTSVVNSEPASEAAAGIANPEAIANSTTSTEIKKESVGEELARMGMKQEESRKVASATTTTTPVAAPVASPLPPKSEHEIVVESKERTWAKVVVDNEDPIEMFLPGGEKSTYRAKEKIKLVLGNSTGSQVLHNGEAASGKKFQGTIRSYIFPSNARFPQDVKKVESTENANTNNSSKDSAF